MIHLTNIQKFIKQVEGKLDKTRSYRDVEDINHSLIMQEEFFQNSILLQSLKEALEKINERSDNMAQTLLQEQL